MTKKLLFLLVVPFFLVTGCLKNIEGIQNFKNWKLDWNPNFGLSVLNANISYSDLQNMIPQDSNFTVTEGAGGILVIHANQNILSALNDFFVLQNFSYSPATSLPIGGNSSQSATFQIPFTELINLKGVEGTIQSIKFAKGTINLKLQGNGVQNINSITATLGGVSSENISPTSNNEIVVPINLNDKAINLTSGNIVLNITVNPKPSSFPSQASLSLTSNNLDLSAITVKDFVYKASTIETNLSMNFFDRIDGNNPGFGLTFNAPVKLFVSFNNQSNLKVSLSDLKATYHYKKGNPVTNKITAITGGATNQTASFDILGITDLLKSITFTTNATISTLSSTPLTLSKTENVVLKGSVEIPLDVNIQNANYETDIDLPKITDTKILDALENLTIKTSSDNGFPVELACKLQALKEDGSVETEITLDDIVKGKNSHETISLDNAQIRKFVGSGKGKVVLGIATHTANGQPGTGKFTTADKLNLRLGLSIKANGKEILNSL